MTTEMLLASSLVVVALSAAALVVLLRDNSWLSRRLDRAVSDTTSVLS